MRLRAFVVLVSCVVPIVTGAFRAPADARPASPAAFAAVFTGCGSKVLKDDGTAWECTFVDYFDGTELDRTRWAVQDSAVTGVTNGSGGCYLDKPWTIAVASGTLRLSAHRTANPFLCKSPYSQFRTDLAASTISTKGRFSQAYGRFSFRAKLPATRVQGAHSALWLFPDKNTYGAWPLSGEIDVAEWYSVLPDRVYPSLHYIDGVKDVQTGEDNLVANPSGWHVYTVEWTPSTMRFLVDGKKTYEHASRPLAPLLGGQPFDQPFNVVMTQAWGGLWNARTEETPDRVTMMVDWVRVWK